MAQGGWSATAVLQVGDVVSERRLIDTESEVTIGRSPRAGLRSPSENGHVPRELARLKHISIGWVLANSGNTVGGTKAPVRVRGPYIDSAEGAEFAPNSMIILQEGEWTLEWALPIRTVLTLTPLSESSDAVDLAVARDRAQGTSGNQTLRASPVSLTPVQRTRMAALFAYLVREENPPENRYRAAADLLGESVEQVKSTAQKVQRKINDDPFRKHAPKINGVDELGRHLVRLSRTIGEDDLEDAGSNAMPTVQFPIGSHDDPADDGACPPPDIDRVRGS